jgi:hypothetical protein
MNVSKKLKQVPETSRKDTRRLVLDDRPCVEPGINVVEKPEDIPVFQELVASELYTQGEAVWIDTKNQSSTYALSSAGSPELLERVRIGRAFTPFQHHNLVRRLEKFIEDSTELLVLPQFTFLYLEGQVSDWEAEELFEESWEEVKKLQREHGLKVLVSIPQGSGLGERVVEDADETIEAEQNSEGVRINSESSDREVYAGAGGPQTTLHYWRKEV